MKKRKYVKPAIDAIRIETESFIAVSAKLDNTLQPGDPGTFTPTDPAGEDYPTPANAKRGMWDDWSGPDAE